MCLQSSGTPESLEAEGPKCFAEDAQTYPRTARNGKTARAGGIKPGRESAAAQVDRQMELRNGTSPSHRHTHPSMEEKGKRQKLFLFLQNTVGENKSLS